MHTEVPSLESIVTRFIGFSNLPLRCISNVSWFEEKGGYEMKKIARRDKLKIYGDLLTILDEEPSREKVVLTRVQVRLNVPFDRLKGYISELRVLN